MGHDTHFLQRLDRVKSDHVDFLLGLYRDHELVKYLLSHVKLPPGTERVALAVEDGGEGPHAVVACDGGFVTCLGKGMRTGELFIVSRAHLDGLAAKNDRIREGLALARTRGLDDKRAVKKLESAGPSLSREDFVATAALLGPATTVLTETYANCAQELGETMPFLLQRDLDARLRREWTREVAAHAWGMAHAALMHIDSASRDWIEEWAELPAHGLSTPWMPLVKTMQGPFVVRAAWNAARMGKAFLPHYRRRFAASSDPFNFMEAGWGLVAMATRHASLRGDAVRALQGAAAPDAPDNAFTQAIREKFAELAGRVGTPEETALADLARDFGRERVAESTAHLADDARYRFHDPKGVPDELALPALLEAPFDTFDPLAGFPMTLGAVVASARLRAEELYFPATFLHARGGAEDLGVWGTRLVERNRAVLVSSPVRLEGPKVGRNDPCPCGSGKKHKKCHGR